MDAKISSSGEDGNKERLPIEIERKKRKDRNKSNAEMIEMNSLDLKSSK
jgi:hypothetical protein